MMRIYCLVLALTALVLLAGCQNLMHKAFASGGKVEAVKIVLGVDPESGNPLPLPQQVIIGFGGYWLIDMPMTDDSEAWYYNEESAWFGDGISSKTFVYMRSGNGVIKGHIKVQVEDDKLIDIPIFKIYNPLSSEKEIKIDGKAVAK